MAVSSAYTVVGLTLTFVSTGDLSTTGQYYAGKLDTNGKVVLAAAGTDKAIGIILNDPIAAGEALVGCMGVYTAKLGGTIAVGDLLTSDAAGKLIATTTDKDIILAQAICAGAANEIVPVLVGPFGKASF